MIQHYFQQVHDVDITIVDAPPTSDGIVIALEKDNLAAVATHIKSDGCTQKALVLNDPSLYYAMDDKAESSWRELESAEVRFSEIPTIDMKSSSEPDVMKFIKECTSFESLMLKPADEAASVGQAVVSTQDVAGILSYLGMAYIAQPYFSTHKILTIDFLAIDGEVEGQHCFYVDGPIENMHWKTGLYQQVLCNATPEIRKEFETIQELTKQLCRKHRLNGIFEIEFLHAHGQTFFLELNLLPGLYGIDQNGLMPLMEKILVPYLQHFQIDIQPQLDFAFTTTGQFYPPSNKSHDYYVHEYGEDASTREDSSEVTTTESAHDDEGSSACSSEQIYLLMPTCAKWGDKARMIKHYFQRLHSLDITIVDAPPAGDGIVIALEKDNLASVVAQVKSEGSNLKALVVKEPSLYFDMDDKSESSWRELPSECSRFNEIPTVNMKTANELDVMEFVKECASADRLMLKPADEAASVGQAVVPIQNVPEILSYLGKAYVAQPFFCVHKILTIDFLAVDGEVKGHHCFYVDGPIENRHWKTGLYQQVVCNATPEIKKEFETIEELTRSLCKTQCLNGIFEIEFLYANGKAYFLELNLLPGLYGIDKNGLMPLMEKVLVPYLQHFQIDIQPRLDLEYEPTGQFYPPSNKSHEYYMQMYGEALDVTSTREDSSELTLAGSSTEDEIEYAPTYQSEEILAGAAQ